MSDTSTDGYKEHVAGSRKGRVHEIYETKGQEAAETWGLKQGLAKGTLRSWIGFWRRADKAADKPAETKAAEKKAADKTAKKAGKPKGDKVKKVTKGNRQSVTKADASMETPPTA